MKKRLWPLWIALGSLLVGSVAVAQWGRRRYRERREAPELTWPKDSEQPEDVFTFVRLRYSSWRRSWDTDYPDADKNMSFRLQQLTSMKVDPDPKALDITDPALFEHPFVYMVEPGGLELADEEVTALRKYLEAGGFLMVDDFWGADEWANFEEQIGKVFPGRKIVDLPIEHPIFHAVFDLKEKPQIPSISYAHAGLTHERGEDGREVHYRAIFDDKGRMMVIICHNTDLGDGWEREGEDAWYFKEFSEKKAYPMGINIIFYAMTH